MSDVGRMARATRDFEGRGEGVGRAGSIYHPPFTPIRFIGASKTRFGKPLSSFQSGAEIELDPCDAGGTDTGEVNVTAKIPGGTVDIGSHDAGMGASTTGCVIASSQIVQWAFDKVGQAWVVGEPYVSVQSSGFNSTTHRMTHYVRWVIGGARSNASSALDAIQFYDCTS